MLDNRTLATVRTYALLISVLRARSDELEITREITEAAGKLPDGFSGRLLSRKPVRSVGLWPSLGALLGVLGLALVVVEDKRTVALPRRKYRRQRKPAAAELDVAGHLSDSAPSPGTV